MSTSPSQPVGYDVDIANELARRLDIDKVDVVASDIQSFIEGVEANRFDIVITYRPTAAW